MAAHVGRLASRPVGEESLVQPDLFERTQGPRVYTVSQINELVRRLLDESFGLVVVEGEVSNARRQSSGHWYFTLKDKQANLGAVMFRSDANALRFQLENGLHVRTTGRLSLYPPQGKFQLQVRRVEPVGHGTLELAFRQLRDKLQREGLFDAARKRALPRLPARVALVTSPTGAAVRDMITTFRARWPLVDVLVVPVSVQGEMAAPEIAHALQLVNRLHAADVVILARGGGSLEDLWAFNEEGVARAIAASSIPVVCGVGHETDTTIADFVADVRAATPTAAAARVVPQRAEIEESLRGSMRRMARALRRRCELERQRLDAWRQSYAFRRPRLLLEEAVQSLDARQERLSRALRALVERGRTALAATRARLNALSPHGVLARGYAYCEDADTGQLVARAAATRKHQGLTIHFADGTAPARVEGAWKTMQKEQPR
jgi:exodeoxyribonuclease VII large subunit